MPEIAAGRDALARAERRVAQGETRVRRQASLVGRLRCGERPRAEAERLLRNLELTLVAWRDHRDAIRRTVRRLEADRRAPGDGDADRGDPGA